jgi:hypothetical protein
MLDASNYFIFKETRAAWDNDWSKKKIIEPSLARIL